MRHFWTWLCKNLNRNFCGQTGVRSQPNTLGNLGAGSGCSHQTHSPLWCTWVLPVSCPSSWEPSPLSRSLHCWLALESLKINYLTLELHCGILKAHWELLLGWDLPAAALPCGCYHVASCCLLDFTSSHSLFPHSCPMQSTWHPHTSPLPLRNPLLPVDDTEVDWMSLHKLKKWGFSANQNAASLFFLLWTPAVAWFPV